MLTPYLNMNDDFVVFKKQSPEAEAAAVSSSFSVKQPWTIRKLSLITRKTPTAYNIGALVLTVNITVYGLDEWRFNYSYFNAKSEKRIHGATPSVDQFLAIFGKRYLTEPIVEIKGLVNFKFCARQMCGLTVETIVSEMKSLWSQQNEFLSLTSSSTIHSNSSTQSCDTHN
jgi:hypothetical protein